MYSTGEVASMGPFAELALTVEEMQKVAGEVMRGVRKPGVAHRPHWRLHWLSSARTAWGRRHVEGVQSAVERVPEYSGPFLTDARALRERLLDEEVADALAASQREAIASDVRDDPKNAVIAVQRTVLRAKARRRMAMWSSGGRRLVSQVVLDRTGDVANSPQAEAGLMYEHWPFAFGNNAPSEICIC